MALISCTVTALLVCAFVLIYAKSMFSLDKVHIKLRFYSVKGGKADKHITLDLHREFSLLAHLSQRLIGELIAYPCSGVNRRCCHCRRCQIVCINRPGHMTKMAAMPIYGKNLQNSSPPKPVDRFPRNLVCSIGPPAHQSLYK